METLFSNQYANIFLHSATHQTIEIQWLDFVPSADFRLAVEKVMGLASQHRVLAMVADNRLLRAVRPRDLDWCGEVVFQGLSNLGGRRFAIIESLDAINRMGVTALVASVIPGTKLTNQYFSTIEEARAWATAPF